MIKNTITFVLLLLLLSACQKFTALNGEEGTLPHSGPVVCQASVNKILSCLSSSKNLSSAGIASEFDMRFDSWKTNKKQSNVNRMLCLSLHPQAMPDQLKKGEQLLQELLRKNECKQTNLPGLLCIIQGNRFLHKTYLDQNWKLYVEKKKLREKKEITQQELASEITSYQRRIKDLEKQVQKLIDIESMLDQKILP